MRQVYREATWYRSMLFVPGHKPDWMAKAPRFGADAYIFDLEDAVPVDRKPAAREAVAAAIAEFADAPFGTFARLNGWRTGHTVLDALAVVGPGLDGVMLTKVEDVEDIAGLDLLLTDLEIAAGLPVGRIEIIPRCETALGMYRYFEICSCSERVRRAPGAGDAVPGGDDAVALNLRQVTDEGDEWIEVNGRVGLVARAAGVTQILGGMTNKIDDLDLVRRVAQRAKNLGANGATAIHPSHVPILNEVFSPSPDEIGEARTIVAAMAEATEQGSAAVRVDGRMIDYAHVRRSLELLERARSIGLDVGTTPDISVLSLNYASPAVR